ncbi:MFS transporter [Streptomyces thinghirensis]|uniref:MFS transporter n=1 Tax=Streptomyces thinghirensis TaxID=551547 RepID=A0ABP9T4K1_9ACTN
MSKSTESHTGISESDQHTARQRTAIPESARTGPEPSTLRRVVAAAMAGTVVEWYEFFLYAAAAALVFGTTFFPATGNPLDGVIAAMLTYFVGFVARPLGGLIFGHFGDKYGRKKLLQFSLVLVGVATFVMGLLPTFDQVGYWAPALLVALRFVQGFAVGGEWGGAVLLIAEHSPDSRRGFYASFPQAAVPLGNLLATGVLLVLSSVLSEAQFLSWGWRIGFFLSAIVVLVGWYIRSKVEDADIFKEAMEQAKQSESNSAPILEVCRRYPRNIITGMGMKLVENIWYWLVVTFSITYLHQIGVETDTILELLLAAHFVNVFLIPFVGHLSDRLGRRPIYLIGVVLVGIQAFTLFPLYNTKNPALIVLGISLGVFTWSLMYAPQAALLVEMFPTRMRYSGVSITYQMVTIFGGSLAPVIATTLLRNTGSWIPIAIYVATAAAISLVATLLMRETRGSSLHHLDHKLEANT